MINKTSFLAAIAVALFTTISSADVTDASRTGLDRAKQTISAIYTHYSVPENYLLRENYPHDDTYKAGYLASEDQSVTGNSYSFLWPFSGTLSAVAAIIETDPSWKDTLDMIVLPGLQEYYDAVRQPAAYASYIETTPLADRFYDDNIWLGIDFTDLYRLTGDKSYLANAEEIWKFIESGTDDVLGGGIYWCEQKKGSKNTCSNAPGSVYATKLYMATANPAYLAQGIELYNWTKSNLLDTSDYLYFDNVNLEGKVARQKYSYNSGQMIQAACLIYNITKDQTYLDDARRTAAACYGYYFEDWTAEDGAPVKVLKKGNVWFHAVMLRGLIELYRIDGDPTYIDAVRSSLDVAWNHGRSAEGLFGEDCRTPEEGKKWLLTQGAMAEMYARIAAVGRSR